MDSEDARRTAVMDKNILLNEGRDYVVDVSAVLWELRYPLSDVPTEGWTTQCLKELYKQTQLYADIIRPDIRRDEIVVLCYKTQDRLSNRGASEKGGCRR